MYPTLIGANITKHIELYYPMLLIVRDKIKRYNLIIHLVVWLSFIYYLYYILMPFESAIYFFKINIPIYNINSLFLILIACILILIVSLILLITDIREKIFRKIILFVQFILMIFLTSIITILWANYVGVEQKLLLILLNLVVGFLFFVYFDYLKQIFE